MRLQCTIAGTKIPNSYHFLFTSLIKKSLTHSARGLVEELYVYENKKNKKSKHFTFSVFLQNFERRDDELDVKGNIIWNISSPDSSFLLYLYNGLLANKKFNYQGYNIQLQNIRLGEEKLPYSEEVLFSTLSPIVVKNKEGVFLSPEDEGYESTLNYICNVVLENIRGTSLQEPLQFTPVSLRKQIVKQKHEDFWRLNKEKTLYVNAYKGLFKLKGHPEDLRLLTQSGIGFRRSQGFGNVRVLHG